MSNEAFVRWNWTREDHDWDDGNDERFFEAEVEAAFEAGAASASELMAEKDKRIADLEWYRMNHDLEWCDIQKSEARKEGAREMRERAAIEADRDDHVGLAADIRALRLLGEE